MEEDKGYEDEQDLKFWSQEVRVQHRWGRHGKERANEEVERLKKLWDKARPLEEKPRKVMEQLVNLEICNWLLEDSILALCGAIGTKRPSELSIGHMASMTEERWNKVWAYYLALRDWLPNEIESGYHLLLKIYDPKKRIREHVYSMLGERNELKELYVARLVLLYEYWLGGQYPKGSAPKKPHDAAVSAIEKAIKKKDPKGEILGAFKYEGDGKLNLCHHKLFRRYDIIISSIGAGKWRGAIELNGADGFERAALLEKYVTAIETWTGARDKEVDQPQDEIFIMVQALLGKQDLTKIFLASLFASLLQAQQIHAKNIAESHASGQ